MTEELVVFALIGALAGGITSLLTFNSSLPSDGFYIFTTNLIIGAVGGLLAGTGAKELDIVVDGNYGPMLMSIVGSVGLVVLIRSYRVWLLHHRPGVRI